MATISAKVMDENAIQNAGKIQIGKSLKGPVVAKQKRAALGELGNRAAVHPSLLAKIKNEKEDLKEAGKQNLILRNAKPKVDTHWENIPTVATRKLIRNESLKVKPQNTSVVTVSTNSLLTKNGITSLRSSVREQKPVIKVTKPIIASKKNESQIRREDSNLSTRSLTKLRAALAKDAAKRVSKPEKNTLKNKTTAIKSEEIEAVSAIEKVTIKEHVIPTTNKVQIISCVENIDAKDAKDIFGLAEYVNDIYLYFSQLETKFSIQENFLKNQTEVTSRMRTVLIDWINEVANIFHLIPETYQMSVGIIDRYLQVVSNTSRANFQLVGVTALIIAAKYEELYPADISDYVYITDMAYTKDQILEMEMKMLKALDFELSRPIPLLFLRRFIKAQKCESDSYVLAKYILELVSIEYSLAHYKPSRIAAAALYLSLQLFNSKKISKDKLWTATAEYYSGYSAKDLKHTVHLIAKCVKNAPKAKYKTVYTKYQSEKYSKISTRSELYGKVIDSVINETNPEENIKKELKHL